MSFWRHQLWFEEDGYPFVSQSSKLTTALWSPHKKQLYGTVSNWAISNPLLVWKRNYEEPIYLPALHFAVVNSSTSSVHHVFPGSLLSQLNFYRVSFPPVKQWKGRRYCEETTGSPRLTTIMEPGISFVCYDGCKSRHPCDWTDFLWQFLSKSVVCNTVSGLCQNPGKNILNLGHVNGTLQMAVNVSQLLNAPNAILWPWGKEP